MMNNMLNDVENLVSNKIENNKIKNLFKNVYGDALLQSIKTLEDGSVFMLTGDIPAMWLRDSSCQIRPYLPFLDKYIEIKQLVSKLIDKQFFYILNDPYANAFNEEANGDKWDEDIPLQKPIVWERKFELDSHCFPILLSYQYWEITGDTSIFNKQFFKAIELVLDIWLIEQNHNRDSNYTFYREETGYLENKGKGSPTRDIGLVWSAFRPSDDPCKYHFNIPGNIFILHSLKILKYIINITNYKDYLITKIDNLYRTIKTAIKEYGIINLPNGKKIFAYEVNGFGDYLLMDDSNMPSLLSLPLISSIDISNKVYLDTRDFILSENNPYYYEGALASGIGSPHTPEDHIWPLALAVQGLTTNDIDEKYKMMKIIAENDADTLQVHESFHKNNNKIYTREWFSWANAMYCELVLDYCGISIKI